jgi:regulator of sigma E protease
MASLLAILALGLLIVVHEMGHMFVARLFGMRVDRFSLGFGLPLLRWRGKKTLYQIAMVPLGGFVQIAGMNPQEKPPPDDPGSYANKSTGARFATIFAGPATNYVFAALLMIAVMLIWGLPRWQQVIAEVIPGSPAARAAMRAGDVIEAIENKGVSSISEVTDGIAASKGRPLRLRVQRGRERLDLVVTPAADGKTYRIGIQFGRKLSFTPLGAGGALLLGLLYPLNESRSVIAGLGQLFRGRVSVKQVGGPLEIIRQLKMSFEESLAMALIFLAMLNVYLGLFNLLPIPALDGGRLVFLLSVFVLRRPVNQQIENAVHTVGFLVLLGLILLVTYRDLARLLGGP